MSGPNPSDVGGEAGEDRLEAATAGRSELPPLRSLNAFATFESADDARDALVALERAGIDGSRLSALALTREAEHAPSGDGIDQEELYHVTQEELYHVTQEEDVAFVSEVAADGAKGGVLGAVLGALGGAAVAVAIPGLGTVVGAGIIGAAAGGAVAGAGVGTFAGAVSATPANRSWQRALVEVGDGEIVVGIHTDELDDFATGVEVLDRTSVRPLRKVDHDGELI